MGPTRKKNPRTYLRADERRRQLLAAAEQALVSFRAENNIDVLEALKKSGEESLLALNQSLVELESQLVLTRDVRDYLDKVADDLRNQYSIAYASDNEARDGTWREIELKTRDRDLRVFTRRGYYAPTE